jgi:hypothetical protein
VREREKGREAGRDRTREGHGEGGREGGREGEGERVRIRTYISAHTPHSRSTRVYTIFTTMFTAIVYHYCSTHRALLLLQMGSLNSEIEAPFDTRSRWLPRPAPLGLRFLGLSLKALAVRFPWNLGFRVQAPRKIPRALFPLSRESAHARGHAQVRFRV